MRAAAKLRRSLMIIALLTSISGMALGQNYVFMRNSGTTYYYASGNTWSSSSSFSPDYIWTIDNNVPKNNDRYMIISRTYTSSWGTRYYTYTPSLSASTNSTYTFSISDGNVITTSQPADNGWGTGNSTYYLPYNLGTLSTSTGTNDRVKAYQVNTTTVTSISTNPTIDGPVVLTATGNTTYTATGAAYRIGYTNYNFNSADHYYDASGNSFTGTPANATLGTAVWDLTDNAYATVNSSGVINVSTLPANDITLTLTVTIPVSGGTPAAPAGTTLTATKQITIQGTTPSAPIISVSGTTVTLSTTAAGTTTIRYTINGNDPTANSGTVYNGTPFDIGSSATSPVIIRAVTVRNGNASSVSEQSVTLTLPEPVITADATAGTATISAMTGATIYYTTDGTTPTTLSTQFSGALSGLSPMTTIKAIAVKDGWNESPVASETLRIPSGADGSTVTLFDLEDHSWSYYSDASLPSQLHSLSPADVKITYYGDGIVMTGNDDYTAGMAASNYVVPGDANYVGGAKVNVGGEDENTFIYYKTLERGDATDATWTFSSDNQSSAASRCPYTPIYNPFQVRPTYGARTVNGNTTDANDFTGWRGFQCWRLQSVSGGAVYRDASNGTALEAGAIITAGTPIYFAPDSEYGMEVAFEAVWAKAYLIKANNSGNNAVLSYSLGVERNFLTLINDAEYAFNGSGNARRITNLGYPVTISDYYPNGEAPSVNANGPVSRIKGTNSQTNQNNIVLQGDTKFENTKFSSMSNNNYTLNAAGHDLIVGRGCSGTVNTIQGISSAATNTFRFRVESGTYTYLYFMGASGVTSGYMYATLGSDYDRAKNEQNGPKVNTDILISNAGTVGQNNNVGNEVFQCTVKSGDYDLGSYGGGYQFYLSSPNGSMYASRKMFIEGGVFSDIAGGIESSPSTIGDHDMVTIRIKGGTIKGVTFGAAQFAESGGHRKIVITGGDFKGWIAGGANGTRYTKGGLYGKSYLYFGGNAKAEGDNSNTVMNSAVGGNVFGAGCGFSNGSSSGEVTQGTTVVIADNAYVQRGVYGGGAFGFCNTSQTANIYITGGTVGGKNGSVTVQSVSGTNDNATRTGVNYSGSIQGGVFGGANQNKGGTVNIIMTGGQVGGGIYGGSNYTGIISGNATININGGQVGTSESNASVYGGGLGDATRMKGDVKVNVGSRTDCAVSGSAVIYGDVYGGSAKGITNCNDAGTALASGAVTDVTLNKGTINGSLYGGGHGIDNATANVWGPVTVKVYGGTLTGGVYGANNLNGAPQNSVTVDIYGTDPQPGEGYAIANVYGGGNQAAYNNATYPTVTVHNCNNSIGNVYGGGNAAAVTNTNVTIYGGNRIGSVYAGGNGTGVITTFQMVTGNAVAKIYGDTIGRVFAGNNSSGIVNGTKTVTIDATINEATNAANCITCGDSPMKIGAVFQGGNQAAGSPGTVNIVCTGNTTAEYIDTLFGGANNANIVNNNMSTAADVALTIDRGYIRSGIFGGNNAGGKVTGNITINLTRNSEGTCAFNYPTVFGGGFGEGTSTGGNITINIGEKTATNTSPTIVATIEGGAVYGGSALGSVNDASNETTTVNIYNGTISGNIYGGGLGEAGDANKGKVNGVVTVNIGASDQSDGNCTSDLTACSVYGCNNTGGSPQGNVTVHVYRTGHTAKNLRSYTESDATYAIDQVFGGGNAADYTPAGDNKATVYIHNCDNTVRRVFGGGNAAAAKGVVTTIEGGRYDYVFGGGNGEDIAANIGSGGTNLTVSAGLIHHLFGGSNEQGTINGPMRVSVSNSGECDEQIDEFFGGGNLANLGSDGNEITLNTTIECNTVFGDIYGGSNLADIYGTVTLTVNGGQISRVFAGSKGVASGDATYPSGKAANIYGNVKLNIYGGDIERAFGGSNINGNISGTIGVDLDWSQSSCSQKEIDYIYGASNDATYTPTAQAATGTNYSPTVKLINGTVGVNVYGGGKGATAIVSASPKVIVGDATNAANKATVNGDVFGGGDAADVNGRTNVIVGHTSTVMGNVFGGGNAAAIKKVNGNYGNTLVILKDKARVYKNVYGGGNQGVIESDTKVVVNGN